MLNQYLNKVFYGDALHLLRGLPSHAVDGVFADPMYGVAKNPKPRTTYDWGADPFLGNPEKWWKGIPGVHSGHRRIYHECLRVLKPGGKLAWAMGVKFRDYFPDWFGGYRIWSFCRYEKKSLNAFGHIWIVQTADQHPVAFPDKDSLIVTRNDSELRRLHPCPKAVAEMEFLVENLSEPNDVIMDCFAGSGTTLVAAKRLRRNWIGCDLSRAYCRVTLSRLSQVK